ncbi:MAG: PleD family two-component system response regulator [Gemmataceae bacterium]
MARILIIDDDDDVRAVVRIGLESAGHQVLEASDGELGLFAYAKHAPDLVLCDIFMSGKEGLETIRDLRSKHGDVKVIAMSGGLHGGEIDFLPIAKKFGASHILAKPFQMQNLMAAIDELIKTNSI